MDKETRGVLLGMVIGDGYIQPHPTKMTATLAIRHGAVQLPYVEHKADILHRLLGGKRPAIHLINNNGYPGVVIRKSNRYFRILRHWVYKNREKVLSRHILDWLTPQGIALWYMDDGGLGIKIRRDKIHGVDIYINCHTTFERAQTICAYFLERWKLVFHPNKNRNSYRIRGGTQTWRDFSHLFAEFIIPSMAYKIIATHPRTSARHPSRVKR